MGSLGPKKYSWPKFRPQCRLRPLLRLPLGALRALLLQKELPWIPSFSRIKGKEILEEKNAPSKLNSTQPPIIRLLTDYLLLRGQIAFWLPKNQLYSNLLRSNFHSTLQDSNCSKISEFRLLVPSSPESNVEVVNLDLVTTKFILLDLGSLY